MALVEDGLIGLGERGARGRLYPLAKRLLDIAGAATGLVVLSPLLLALALVVRLDSPGPALFRQVRTGLKGRPFLILKFRTLAVGQGDPTGLAQVTEGDSRLTGIGAFLRRTSLDELPQLINVLLGDMSLVGPRPHVPDMLVCGEAYDILAPGYDERHAVRPGITGLAQVSGLRGPLHDTGSARARLHHDLDYIRRRSLALDLSILWFTLIREVLPRRRR